MSSLPPQPPTGTPLGQPLDPNLQSPLDVQPVAPPKSVNPLWLLILIPVAVFVILLLFAALVGITLFATSEQTVTEADREVLIDINQIGLRMEDDYSPIARGETITKLRYLDGSFELDYEYDVPEDPDAPYLNCTVYREMTVQDARGSYTGLLAGSSFTVNMFAERDVEFVERNDLLSWGDTSYFSVLQCDGQPVGNFFVARRGRLVFYLIVSGVYFDDPDNVRGLLAGVLDRLETYEP